MTEERINPEEEPEPVPEPEKDEDEEEDLSDLFEVHHRAYEEADISDLVDFTDADREALLGMGKEEESEEKPEVEEKPHWSDEDIRRYEELQRQQLARKPTYKRTAKRYTPPDQMGGIRQL